MRIIVPTKTSDFLRNYRLPIYATVGFVFILLALVLWRAYEQRVLAQVLGSSRSVGGDYATLLSSDKDQDLAKNQVANDVTGGDQAAPAPSATLNLDSSGNSTTTIPPDNTGGDTTDPAPPSEPEPDPPAEPFSANLIGFNLRSQSGPAPCDGNTTMICKTYEFIAGVNTFNGPGAVQHKLAWRGPLPGEVSGNFTAQAGDATVPVVRVVKLKCETPGPFIFTFYLLAPVVQQSQDVHLNHFCTAPGPGF